MKVAKREEICKQQSEVKYASSKARLAAGISLFPFGPCSGVTGI